MCFKTNTDFCIKSVSKIMHLQVFFINRIRISITVLIVIKQLTQFFISAQCWSSSVLDTETTNLIEKWLMKTRMINIKVQRHCDC